MKNFFEVRDTVTGEDYTFNNWQDMASFVVQASQESDDYARYLPSYNYWNLDYAERGETVAEYKGRLIDMAIGLQLIG